MKRFVGLLAAILLASLLLGSCQTSNVRNTGPAYLVEEHTGTSQETTVPETSAPTETTEATLSTTIPATEAAVSLPVGEGGRFFIFSSGVGGWRTELTLHEDGTFAGMHLDSEMGICAEDYPDGTVYVCDFFGAFSDITQLDEHTYKMTLLYLQTLDPDEEEWIQDGVRYVVSEPYGIVGGHDFILYLPETPLEGLSEDFMLWWPLRYDEESRNTLGCYGIENIAESCGFFSVD